MQKKKPPLWATALGSGGVVLAVGGVAWAFQVPTLAPPLGVTAFLCCHSPRAPSCTPRSIIIGHLLGVLSGLFALYICGADGLPAALAGNFSWRHALASALALFLTVLTTEGLKSPHPPASATTLVVSLGLLTEVRELMAFGVGVLLTAALAPRLSRLLSGSLSQHR